MENRSRLLVIALVAVLAVLGGFAFGAFLSRDPGSAGATPSPIAAASASPLPAGSDEPSAEASGAPSHTPSDAVSAEPSASVPPSAAAASRATITFTRLFIDAQDNPDGADRILRFESGPGATRVDLASITPQGATVMCLSTPTQELGCKTTGKGTLNAKTTKPRETFIVTLRGEGIAQPLVDVTLTFPATQPSVTIENARFDGTAYPETNGIQAIVTPRRDGDVGIVAEWGGHPLLYEITLTEQDGPGGTSVQPDSGNVGTETLLPVTAGHPWMLVLQNTESGFGVTPMTARVSWP